MDFHHISLAQCLKDLKTTKEGIGSDEAQKRQIKYGKNEIEGGKKQSNFIKFLSGFKDIMIVISLFAALISIVVAVVEKSASELVDGLVIIGIALLNVILGFVQENKAENALEKLKNMTKPEAKVLRDGQVCKISNSFLTLGDVVFLEPGDIVPADLRILESANLFCDESSLTGESVQVSKDASFRPSEKSAIADRKNMLYSGTIVTNGRATGVVTAIGGQTEIGLIASALSKQTKDLTPLQKSLKYVSKIITIIVLIVAVITLLTEILLRPEEPLIEAFLIAVALAVAAIPESLPAVITVIMSFGVSILAKKNAIVKKLQAVETLGSCNIICSDKTGTITQNLMTVKELYYDMKNHNIEQIEKNEDFEKLLTTMTLCNDSKQNQGGFFGDSTETALVNFSYIHGVEKSKLEKTFSRIDEISFNSGRKRMSTLNQHKQELILHTKGGVDNVLPICSTILIDGQVLPLTEQTRLEIEKANEKMAGAALRVLAFASRIITNQNKEDWENKLTFIGLVGMIDPPRKEVKEAIEKCRKAGIRPVMITGDHKATAFAIAKEVGIASNLSEVMLGIEIDKLDDKDFLEKLKTASVFARVSPENKVRIVSGFKKLGFITAMTGDGVNDAPSLKAASIGVGMGITGTDITKDVADLIVADDNFATIVLAVEEGRKIYKNIQKTIKFLFSANLGEILSIFLATLIFPQTIFLLPIQILFVNLITDSLPAIAMSFETSEKDLMSSSPRDSKENIFSSHVGLGIIIMGIVQAILILLAFYVGTIFDGVAGFEHNDPSTMAFITLNLIQFCYIFSVRFESPLFKNNPFKNHMQNISFFTSIILMLIFTISPINSWLGFSYLNYFQWLIVLGLSLLILPIAEYVKWLLRTKK